MLSYLVVQSLVLGAAAFPVGVIVHALAPRLPEATWARVVACAVGLLPTYLAFALALAVTTGAATRALGWRPRAGREMAIREFGWPLLDWARCGMLTHVARLLVGIPCRGSPFWALCLRLNGARLGHQTWINSIDIVDHNLLELGDDVVIGSGTHLSGHTVEDGIVKTGTVRVGRNVTIGVGSVVCVGVEIGDGAQVGALSFVPKGMRLQAGVVYVGAPVHRLEDVERGR